jgi:hypothetical protein
MFNKRLSYIRINRYNELNNFQAFIIIKIFLYHNFLLNGAFPHKSLENVVNYKHSEESSLLGRDTVTTGKSTRWDVPDYFNIQQQHCDNLKSCTVRRR